MAIQPATSSVLSPFYSCVAKSWELVIKTYRVALWIVTHPIFIGLAGLISAYAAPFVYPDLFKGALLLSPSLGKTLASLPPVLLHSVKTVVNHQLPILGVHFILGSTCQRWLKIWRICDLTSRVLLFPSQFWAYPLAKRGFFSKSETL